MTDAVLHKKSVPRRGVGSISCLTRNWDAGTCRFINRGDYYSSGPNALVMLDFGPHARNCSPSLADRGPTQPNREVYEIRFCADGLCAVWKDLSVVLSQTQKAHLQYLRIAEE